MDNAGPLFAVFAGLMTLVLITGRRFGPHAHRIGFYATLVAIGAALVIFLIGR